MTNNFFSESYFRAIMKPIWLFSLIFKVRIGTPTLNEMTITIDRTNWFQSINILFLYYLQTVY